MFNLVCFPHYTAGGLLCDLLNQKHSPWGDNGGIESVEHYLGKINEIDNDSVLEQFDSADFERNILSLDIADDVWIGTHHWPGNFNTDLFDKIIVITTETERSRILRWYRVYENYFVPQWPFLENQDFIDKARETAKNYLRPYRWVAGHNVQCVEFADIVDDTREFTQLYPNTAQNFQRVSGWRMKNFDLTTDLWQAMSTKFYYQADWETRFNRRYQYV